MTDKLSQILGPEPRRIKVGKSFERKDARSSAYNRIRYDFKPNSIDENREGTLEVRERKEVAVSLPHSDGIGQTNYKGHLTPANPKECVLIIDHDTGEITIERLSNQILMKKTRPEKIENKPGEEKSNPYEVKKVPDKPSFPPPREPQHSKQKTSVPLADSDPPQVSSMKSRGSPVPPRPRPTQPKVPPVVAAPSSNLESSSSSSSSSSDSESDFEEDSKPASSSQTGMGGMPSFGSQDIPFSRGGGVLPTARPPSNKSKKSFGNESKSRPKSNPMSEVQMPSFPTSVPNLDDDLRLSEDSE